MKKDFVREDAKKYELMVIINPDIALDAINKQLEEIKEMLVLSKGEKPEIFFEDVWGMRDIAYTIKKHDRGFYAVYDFVMDPSLLNELDTNLRLEANVLRHMIVKLPFGYESKTLAQIEEVRKAEEEERLAARGRNKPGESGVKKAPVKPAVVVKKEEKAKDEVSEPEEKKEKEEKPKKEVVKKEAAPTAPVAPKETTLEDVDAKLKSIIDNPDINF
jgi:small subunit ribosomal protein S6